MILMQGESALSELFDRLRRIGVRYDMRLPADVSTEYDSLLASIGSMDDLTA
jgi:hypothetical protein